MFSGQKAIQVVAVLTLAASAMIAFSSFSGSSNLTADPPKTVDYVDPNKYLGRWYEQAVIPYFFQRNCHDTEAFYSLIDSKTIRVDNTCYRDDKKVESVGKATIEDSSNAKLKVVFNPIVKIGAQYWIVKLGDAYNYGYSVVSSPDYKYLWILSREKKMDDATYNSIIEWLKSQGGYQVDKLVRTKP